MSKKKKKCKDCKPKFLYGNYVTYGKPSKAERKWICSMLEKGINVYHQYGSPHCGPDGCK